MRGWLPAIALGAVLALLALVAVVAMRPTAEPSSAERSERLAAELRCPDCQGLSVADSPTASAREIRRQIDALLAGGATDDEVRTHFTDRYGEWILLAPTSPIAWALPFAAVLAGLVVLGAFLASRRSAAEPGVPALTDVDRRRVRDEAEALDA
jgi:cytochrome c-type biogenesis protein CcmH